MLRFLTFDNFTQRGKTLGPDIGQILPCLFTTDEQTNSDSSNLRRLFFFLVKWTLWGIIILRNASLDIFVCSLASENIAKTHKKHIFVTNSPTAHQYTNAASHSNHKNKNTDIHGRAPPLKISKRIMWVVLCHKLNHFLFIFSLYVALSHHTSRPTCNKRDKIFVYNNYYTPEHLNYTTAHHRKIHLRRIPRAERRRKVLN